MNIRRTSTRIAALIGTAALGISLSGCAYFNETQTHEFYQAAEGANENFIHGDASALVGVRNLLAVESNGAAHVTGAVTNHSTESVTVNISVNSGGSGSTSVTVPAGETVMIGDGEGFPIETQVKPGDNLVLDVSLDGDTKQLTVPLLDDSLEYLGDTGE